MLTHPTLDLLQQLGLNGMAKAFGEIEASGETAALTHSEWLVSLAPTLPTRALLPAGRSLATAPYEGALARGWPALPPPGRASQFQCHKSARNRMQKISGQRGVVPGRHHLGTLGDIISESLGDFVGIRTQRSCVVTSAVSPARSMSRTRSPTIRG